MILKHLKTKSCTAGENQCVKRPRHHAIPVAARQLSLCTATYENTAQTIPNPHVDNFDPRHINQRIISDNSKTDFGLKLQEVIITI